MSHELLGSSQDYVYWVWVCCSEFCTLLCQMNLPIAFQRINTEWCDVTEKQSLKPVPKWHMTAKLAATRSNIKADCMVLSLHLYIFRAWALKKRDVLFFLKRVEYKWKSAICGEKNITPLLCDSSFQCKPVTKKV